MGAYSGLMQTNFNPFWTIIEDFILFTGGVMILAENKQPINLF